ncbi:MAG TPA: phage protease [Verrucomicrobiae bacterium]|nr:phage protease [Verrucomicrobiae bacterium]
MDGIKVAAKFPLLLFCTSAKSWKRLMEMSQTDQPWNSRTILSLSVGPSGFAEMVKETPRFIQQFRTGVGELPSRLKILGWGKSTSVHGDVTLGELSALVLPQKQRALGFEKVALDFEHNTVPGTAEYNRTSEPRRVAAFGVVKLFPNEGLFLDELEWTPAGQAEARNFTDLSPAVEMDRDGNVLFVHSAALTRNGAVYGLSFFSATRAKAHRPLYGLEKAIAAHKAESGDLTTLSATQPDRSEAPDVSKLTGLAKAIAAHKADQQQRH